MKKKRDWWTSAVCRCCVTRSSLFLLFVRFLVRCDRNGLCVFLLRVVSSATLRVGVLRATPRGTDPDKTRRARSRTRATSYVIRQRHTWHLSRCLTSSQVMAYANDSFFCIFLQVNFMELNSQYKIQLQPAEPFDKFLFRNYRRRLIKNNFLRTAIIIFGTYEQFWNNSTILDTSHNKDKPFNIILK